MTSGADTTAFSRPRNFSHLNICCLQLSLFFIIEFVGRVVEGGDTAGVEGGNGANGNDAGRGALKCAGFLGRVE